MARVLVAVLAGGLALLVAPATTGAHDAHVRVAAMQAISEPCPTDSGDPEPIEPDVVLTGEFRSQRQGSYVMLPVRVPAGQTALRVKYCFDQPELTAPGSPDRHTLDLGLYEPRDDPSRPWGVREFRGWGGSSHPDVTLSPQGYSSEASYLAGERVPGMTTRAFLPGPIPAGEWAVELGLASIVPVSRGDADDRVAYRVEVDWSDDPADADDPYQPAPYDEEPAIDRAGWYAGDFHVHAEHSALGDATMTETFDYAFGPPGADGAGLDFITLSDYVSGASWDEIGRYQADHPEHLIIRSAEVITYDGHANSHANTGPVDYRFGPLLERRTDGTLHQLRGPRPARRLFRRVHRAGGFTQINHPTIFPSAVPVFGSFCRGCPWDYSDRETDYSQVDAIEIATGPPGLRDAPGQPGPNPFTVTAIRFWEAALDDGHRIAAVGSSDSHNAGRTPDPVTQAPIGTATTVVRAPELSEGGIGRGVRAGHTYVKIYGASGPDLRLSARPTGGGGRRAIMGDVLRADRARFTARVFGAGTADRPGPLELLVVRNGTPIRAVAVRGDGHRLSFTASRPGRYRLQAQRGTAIEAVSSPIHLRSRSAGRDRDGGGDSGGRGAPGAGPGSGSGGDPAAGGSAPNDGFGASGGDSAGDVATAASTPAGRADGTLPFTGLLLSLLALLGAGLLGLGAGTLRLTRGA